jgi:hypothetical protein
MLILMRHQIRLVAPRRNMMMENQNIPTEDTMPSEGTLPTDDTMQTDVEIRSGFAGVVEARNATLSSAAAGIVAAGVDAHVESGGASAMIAGRDMQLESGGGFVLISGGGMSIKQGGGQVLVSGGPVNIEQGGAAIMLTPSATLKRSGVMLLISGKTDLGEGSRVLLSAPQALALGAAFGIAFALVNRLLRGRR